MAHVGPKSDPVLNVQQNVHCATFGMTSSKLLESQHEAEILLLLICSLQTGVVLTQAEVLPSFHLDDHRKVKGRQVFEKKNH